MTTSESSNPTGDCEVADLQQQSWTSFPVDIRNSILAKLDYLDLFRAKTQSKVFKDLIDSKDFHGWRGKVREGLLTALYFFFTEDKVLQCGGFDLSSKKWRLLPPLTFLPVTWKPDQDLFIENFLVCAKGGLACINFSESTDKERLIVFNPLSREYRELPAMTYRRNPVLMHMLVNSASQSYQVIVAGSTKSGDEDLSKITEVYDSLTGKWKRMGDVPGSGFSLNDYQSGVFQEGKIFCIGYVDDRQTYRGILGYDVEEGRWSRKWTHPLTFSSNYSILQLLECNGEVYLFSEQSKDRHCTEHWVDRLEWTGDGDGKKTCELINVIKKEVETVDGWSLEIFGPEYTCVPYSDSQLYVFKAYDYTGVVYDIRDQGQSVVALPREYIANRERMFNSLHPILFTIEPSFSTKV
ncbi:hypothetical protein M758_7G103800 [Ceratodon purpureus]|nr:hypothetical protein M758_7G103800 [Ceratodon purpureus]